MTVHYQDDRIALHLGDALQVAETLAPASVRCIVTSPPYYGLRDYGTAGQLGSEDSVAEYVEKLVQLFAALRDVLTDDGTLWLNLGDSYASKPRGTDLGWDKSRLSNPGQAQKRQASALRKVGQKRRGVTDGLSNKNLMGVPWRVALALQESGWILRSDIIWSKPNPMPESVTDRPTKSHEYLFLLAKSERYYYDAEAIAEPNAQSTIQRMAQDVDSQAGSTRANGGTRATRPMKTVAPRFGGEKYGDAETTETRTKSGNAYELTDLRNKRTVWTVPTQPFTSAHFAVYPPELIRPCIRAGSEPGDTILDPFSGSGTTGMVALAEGRNYIGIDLNADYLDLSLRERFIQPPLSMEVTA